VFLTKIILNFSTCIVALLSVAQYQSLSSLQQKVGIGVWLLTFATTALHRNLAVAIVAICLSAIHRIDVQINALFGTSIDLGEDFGMHAVAAFLTASSLIRLRNSKKTKVHEIEFSQSFKWVSWIAGYTIFQCIITVAKNLAQSASDVSINGILLNSSMLRHLGWTDDFLPVRGMWISLGGILFALELMRSKLGNHNDESRHFLKVCVISGVAILVYGVFQKIFGLGHFRNGIDKGVESVLPDLHAFANYALVFMLCSIGIVAQARNWRSRMLWFGLTILSAAALHCSGSRSIIFFGIFASIVMIVRFIMSQRYLWTLKVLGIVVTLLTGFVLVSKTSAYDSAVNAWTAYQSGNQAETNKLLSERPKIFEAAISMWKGHWVLGTGMQTFPRNGKLPEFSGSEFLAQGHPENAHNFFLQTLVEQGALGLMTLVMVLLVPLFNAAVSNWHKNFVLAVVLGNIYAHSLLVSNLYILFWGVIGSNWSPPEVPKQNFAFIPRVVRQLAVAAMVVVAAIEFVHSFDRPPITGAPYCNTPTGLSEDGWSGGNSTFSTTVGANGYLNFFIDAARPDISKSNTLDVSAAVTHEGGIIWKNAFSLDRAQELPLSVFAPTLAGSKVDVAIQSSRCYVPRNLGINTDSRRLGVIVRR